MTVEYRRDFSHNYMLLRGEAENRAETYELRILMSNRIPGLLPIEVEQVNDGVMYRYDITSCQPFRSFCAGGRVTADMLRKLYTGLLHSLLLFEDYLLDSSHLMLDPEYLYMRWETMSLRIAYVPFYRQDLRSSLIALTESILMLTGHEQQDSIVLACRILHALQDRDLMLTDLMQVLEREDRADPARSRAAAAFQKDLRISRPEREEADGWAGEPRELFQTEKESGEEKPEEETWDRYLSEQGEDRKTGLQALLPHRRAVRVAVLAVLPASILFVLLHMQEVLILTDAEMAGAALLLFAVILLALRLSGKIRGGGEKTGQEDAERGAGDRKARGGAYPVWEEEDISGEAEGGFRPLYEQPLQIDAQRIRMGPGEEPAEEAAQVDVTEYGQTVLMSVGNPGGQQAFLQPAEAGSGLAAIRLTGGEMLVGKQATLVDEVIPEETVSRVHARIIRKNGTDFITDLGSRNGTTVDGRPVVGSEEVPLTDGAHVSFAACRYIYHAGKAQG